MTTAARSRRSILSWFVFLTLLAALPGTARAEFHVIRQATLGGEGGWDYVTLDASGRTLYISRSTHVMVVDTDSLKVVGDIPNTPGVHGVALAPEFGRGFTSNGRDTSVTMFDLKTLRVIGRVRVGMRPDAIVYDAASKRVFTLNGGSNDATAIDALTGVVAGTVALGGRPEAPACDGKGLMYVNLEDSSQVVAVDTHMMKVTGRWSVAPGESPTGLAFDAKRGLLFSGCSNKQMVVTNVKTRSVVATVPIGDRVDGVAYDRELGLAISSNGEGSLTLVRVESSTKFSVAATVPTAPGARTLALDPAAHLVYVVTAEFGPAPEPTADQPHPRPPLVPGTFKVLVVGN